MCWVVALGASIESPLIAPRSECGHGFGVIPVPPEDEPGLRAHLPYPCLRYLCSSGDCGCSFPHTRPGNNDRRHRRQQDADRAAIADYLDDLLRSGAEVALYTSWDGRFDDPSRAERYLSPSEVRARTFRFRMNERILICGDANGSSHSQ